MSWLKNLRVAQRLAILIAILAAAVIVVGGTGYFFLNKTNAAMETMYTDKLMAVFLINDSRANIRKIEANTYALMLTTDDKEDKMLSEDISQRGTVVDEDLAKFEQLSLSDEHKTKLKMVRADIAKYRTVRDKVINSTFPAQISKQSLNKSGLGGNPIL